MCGDAPTGRVLPQGMSCENKNSSAEKERPTYDDDPWACWSRGTRFSPCWTAGVARLGSNLARSQKKRCVFSGKSRAGGGLSLTQVTLRGERDAWWTLAATRWTAKEYPVRKRTRCLADSTPHTASACVVKQFGPTTALADFHFGAPPGPPREIQRNRFPETRKERYRYPTMNPILS